MVSKLERVIVEPEVLEKLQNDIRNRTIKCANQVNVNGDTRFWDVSDEASEIIGVFRNLAINQAIQQKGRAFKHTILMVNHITADESPDGSGGGWHVDSVRNQYKLFMYLTECESIENGPLMLFTSNSVLKDRFYILKNYLLGNKFRFNQHTIDVLKKSGFSEYPVLEDSLTPFYVNTSFIHRGAKIRSGERMLITAYMFDKIPESIKRRVQKSEKL